MEYFKDPIDGSMEMSSPTVSITPKEETTTKPTSTATVESASNTVKSNPQLSQATPAKPPKGMFKNILLVINSQSAHIEYLKILKDLYSPAFPNIVAINSEDSSSFSPYFDTENCQNSDSIFTYICLQKVMEKWNRFDGYLLIQSDLVFQYWNVFRNQLDLSKFWIQKNLIIRKFDDDSGKWPWWDSQYGAIAVKQVFQNLTSNYTHFLALNKLDITTSALSGFAEIMYVPQKFRLGWIDLSKKFYAKRVFEEIATPLIPICLENTAKMQNINGLVLWKSEIEKMSKMYSSDYLYIHPVHFSSVDLKSKIIEAFQKNKF